MAKFDMGFGPVNSTAVKPWKTNLRWY